MDMLWVNSNKYFLSVEMKTQTNVHQIFKQVFDKDIGQDKRLGVTKLPLIDLEAETVKEIELRLQPSLNMLKIKEKDRGTLTIKVRVQINELFLVILDMLMIFMVVCILMLFYSTSYIYPMTCMVWIVQGKTCNTLNLICSVRWFHSYFLPKCLF